MDWLTAYGVVAALFFLVGIVIDDEPDARTLPASLLFGAIWPVMLLTIVGLWLRERRA